MPETTNAVTADVLKIVIPFILGVVSTLLFKRKDNKQILLKKRVTIQRLGFTAENQLWGNLKLLYDNVPTNNIHFITIEILNDTERDCEDLIFDFALPETCRIYKHNGQLFTNNVSLELLLEENFKSELDTTRDKYLATQHSESTDIRISPTLQEAIVFYSRHRKFEVPVLNRSSMLRFEFFAENVASNIIEEKDVFCDIIETGIKVIPYIEQEKLEKVQNKWTGIIFMIVFVLFSYPIYKYTTNPTLAVAMMIANFFFNLFFSVFLYRFFFWLKKTF